MLPPDRVVRADFPSIQSAWTRLMRLITSKIGFGDGTNSDNIDGVWVTVTTPIMNYTDFTVAHNLGRVPIGYLVVKKSTACDVFEGTLAATKTAYTLKASGVSVTLSIFFF